jgi:hypothetical protein
MGGRPARHLAPNGAFRCTSLPGSIGRIAKRAILATFVQCSFAFVAAQNAYSLTPKANMA